MEKRDFIKIYPKLENSLKKHGQIEAIHKCKFGVIDGFKRSKILTGKPLEFVEHEVDTLEEYKQLLMDSQPIYLTPKEKKQYAIIRAKEFKATGFSNEDIRDILLKLLRISERQLRNLLPDEYKFTEFRNIGGKISASKKGLVPFNLKEYFGFLNPRDYELLLKAYDKCGKGKFLDVLCKIKEHFSTKKHAVELTQIELEKVKAQLLEDYYFCLEAKCRYEDRKDND